MPNDENNDNLTMILGGEDMTVTKRDGSQEQVRVREFKISELPLYARSIDNEAKTAELVCGKEEGWADTLTRDSLVDVIGKSDEINLSFFAGWSARRLSRTRQILPNIDQKLIEITKAAISESAASA